MVAPLRARTCAILALGLVLPATAEAQSWRTLQRSVSARGQDHLAVDVGVAAGTFTLAPGDAGTLYRLTVRYDEATFDPVVEFVDAADLLQIGMERVDGDVDWDEVESSSFELLLSPAVPISLDLALGLAQAEIELGGLSLDRLELGFGATEATVAISEPLLGSLDRALFEAGAAELRVTGLGNLRAREVEVHTGVGLAVLDLGGEWVRDLDLSVRMGLGEVEIRIPPEVGVRLEKSGLLLHLDARGLERSEDVWMSEGFSSAERRVRIDVEGAAGRLRVIHGGE